MIAFDDVSKSYHGRGLNKTVFRNVSFEIKRGESIGICGANGAGKSTLMRLLAGIEQPTTGRVTRNMSTSWPIGYASCFQSSLTGADNARFIARIYRRDEQELLDYIDDFAQLGPYLYQPVETYSSGMNARLAFGVSLAINFDCYLIDEVTAVGDARFQARCVEAFAARRARSDVIICSHDMMTLSQYAERMIMLAGGRCLVYHDVAEAVETYKRLNM